MSNNSSPSVAANEKSASAANPTVLASSDANQQPHGAVARFLEDWLVVPKLLYFGLNVIIYSTHAFLFQYVHEHWKIEKDEYSWTNFVQFTNIAGSYVFSRLADRTGKYRLIVSACSAAYCFFMCLLMFPMFMGEDQKIMRMAYYLLINSICFFFTAGTFPLLDSMVMSKLSSNPNLSKEMFGRQRLWGTIGHCVIGVIVKSAYDIFNKNLNVMFFTLIISTVGFIAAVFFGIPADLKVEAHSHGHHAPAAGSKDKKEASPASPAAGPRPSALTLLSSPSFSFFLSTVFVAGFVRSIITTYQSPYITKELNYEKGVVSGSIFVRVFPEAALYFFSKEISQYFGIYWVLIIGHLAGVVRMFGYAMVPEGKVTDSKPTNVVLGCIFLLECLKGANSSLVISSAARIASDMASKGLASTAQGLVAGVWQGLSMTIASAAGFFLVKFFNIRGTFVISSTAGAICLVLIFLKFAFIDRVLLSSGRKTVA